MTSEPKSAATEFDSLYSAWKAGDRQARDRIIEQNLGLVGAVVGRFQSNTDEREDLFQVGSVGLIKALNRFDPELGFSFSTYAFHTILGEVRRYLRDKGPVHVSRSLKEKALRVRSAHARLDQQLGREPTLREIAQHLGCEESEVVEALESSLPVLSLYEPVIRGGDESQYLLDRVGVPPKDVTEAVALGQTLDGLPHLEREVLRLRYFDELTQQDVAQRLGISQSQVSRIERAAIVQMRSMLA